MPHSRNVRWDSIESVLTEQATAVVKAVEAAESAYQDLQELYAFAGGTAQLLANQLYEMNPATADEVATVQDAIDSALALHELYLAMTGGTVAADDRLATLRRFT